MSLPSSPKSAGESRRPALQFRLATLLVVVTAAAVLAGLWPKSLSLGGHALLAAWAAPTAGLWAAVAVCVGQWSRRSSEARYESTARRRAAFSMSVVAGIAPTAALGLYWLLIGYGGSNGAARIRTLGANLWELWHFAWLLSILFCPVSVLVYVVSFLIYIRPCNEVALFVLWLCGLWSALVATGVATHFEPRL
jgi:hypothetical protein